MKKLVYVGFKFHHMGKHAGYDMVKNSAAYDYRFDCQKDYDVWQTLLAKKSFFSKVLSRVWGGYIPWVEFRCLLMALRERNLVFHFIYAENTYRYLGFFKWLGIRIVGTYHQPTSYFDSNPEYLRGLKSLDAIIVLSEDAAAYFANKVGREKVHFIPHGVDTDFFSPSPDVAKRRQVLMVGNWLRNFQFANSVFQSLVKIDPDVDVHVVTLPQNCQFFEKHERIHLHVGISDEELLQRYRTASLLFLPLNGFVANNAVLEMAAVGSPVLVASNQPPEESLSALVNYVPLDLNSALDKIVRFLDESETSSAHLRDYVVKKYSWQAIGHQLKDVL